MISDQNFDTAMNVDNTSTLLNDSTKIKETIDVTKGIDHSSVTVDDNAPATHHVPSNMEQPNRTGRRDVVTPPVGSTISMSSSGGSTPQLSPSTLASLRGISSPSHSQISVGSMSNPTLITSALSSSQAKHYDLTPITKNTSDLYCDTKGAGSGPSGNTDSNAMTITPSSQEGYLHGEHLAFPSDLSRSSLSSGPQMPPLQPVVHRRSYIHNNIQSDVDGGSHETDNHHHSESTFLHMDAIDGLFRNHEIEIPSEPAVQFPSRKYYSFTTREQYEEACRYDPDSDDDLFIPSDSDDDDDNDIKRIANAYRGGILPRLTTGLTPYAPHSRPANFDIEQLPEEELKRIFITRGGSSGSSQDDEMFQRDTASSDMLCAHGTSAIPYEQRIPSLHLANRILNESTTSISYTDQEDEDSVLRIQNGMENDDVSLSSRGSCLSLQQLVTNAEQGKADNNHNGNDDDDDIIMAAKVKLRKHRKRKQRKKEQDAAMEWLHSVEANPGIAEAASSKFLTTSSSSKHPCQQQPYTIGRHVFKSHHSSIVALQRQMSSPVITNTIPSTSTTPFTPILPSSNTNHN